MADAPSYRHGRIIFAHLRSSTTGKMQRHPAIILDDNADIIQPTRFDPRKIRRNNVIHVIGVSTKHKTYALPYVQLPFSATGHAATKLREDCGAIVGWYHQIIIPDDVIGFAGDVPPAVMRQIHNAVRDDLAQKLGRELGSLKDIFEELFGGDN
jgi:hypothetical protein